MLKKLLKYDFKSIFKFWWIGAVSTFVLSLIGGACIAVLDNPKALPSVVDASAVFVLIISIIGLVAFVLLTTILTFIRFYRNFFTDEGYLTFTLPVSVGKLLNSKLIMSVTTTFATVIVLGIDVFTMLAVGIPDWLFETDTWVNIFYFLKDMSEALGVYLFVYIIEGIIVFILLQLFFYLFLYCCITLAAVITKKARVITAIGIYYGVNSIISLVFELLILFSVGGVVNRIDALAVDEIFPVIAVIFLVIIAFVATVCTMLYTLQYWMLDRKLNLA